MRLFLPGLIVGFIIGIFALGLLGALVVLHRPRYVAPTKHNRKWRDLPTPAVQAPWERNLFSELKEGMQELERRREEGIDYQWINLTGEER